MAGGAHLTKLLPDRLLIVAIAAGGAPGALARAGLAEWLPSGGADGWPWATFVANLAGTGVLAWAATGFVEHLPPSRYLRPFVATGFCGALTTFSALQVEALRLAESGHTVLAIAYPLISIASGLLIAGCVTGLTRRAVRGR